MHGAAIVPQHEIADLPDMLPGIFAVLNESPELVEQRFGFRKLKSHEIGVAAGAEIEHLASGVGMGADQRMNGARRGARVVGRGDTLAQISAGIVSAVML